MLFDQLPAASRRPVAYGLLNIVSASGIVFANKAVLSTFGFHFTIGEAGWLTFTRGSCSTLAEDLCMDTQQWDS